MGGNAFKNTCKHTGMVVAELKPRIEKIITDIFETDNFAFVGSTGTDIDYLKLYGDIDIALNVEYSPREIYNKLLEHKFETRILPGLNIVSFVLPLHNNVWQQSYYSINGMQVDIILTKNLEFTKFAYHSSRKSRYSGTHRNEILFAIAKESAKYIDEFTIEKLEWNLNGGVFLVRKSRKGKNDRKLKNYKVVEKTCLSDDPLTCMKILLGEDITLDMCDSFESIFSFCLTSKFKYRENRDKIFNSCIEGLKRKNKEIPIELL